MRCKYTFNVKGRIKPKQPFSFEVDEFLFDFKLKKEFLKEIQISFEILDNELPSVDRNPEHGIVINLNVKKSREFEIEEIMRQTEGMLSLFGVESVDIQNPKCEWIAENEEEQKKLELLNYELTPQEIEDHEIKPISFDLIARPIISAVRSKQHHILLSFNKRGRVDIKDKNYIEAIYNFYFVIESHYADGQNKNRAVEKALKKSDEFTSNIKSVLDNSEFKAFLSPELLKKYTDNYLNKPIEEIIKNIVMLRGFLHHYSTKRKKNWHPDKQNEFELEAYVLRQLSHKVAFEIMNKEIYDEEIIDKYKVVFKKAKLQKHS